MHAMNTQTNEPQFAEPDEYAGYGSRVKAAIIDAVVILIVSLVLYFGLGVLILRAGPGRGAATAIVLLLPSLGPTIYHVVCIAEGGQTIGKMMSGVRARRDADGSSVGYLRALIRAIVPAFLWLTLSGGVLDVLWPLWDGKHQTLHDKMAGTVVVAA